MAIFPTRLELRVPNGRWCPSVELPPLTEFVLVVDNREIELAIDKDGDLVVPSTRKQDLVDVIFGGRPATKVKARQNGGRQTR